MAKQVRVILPYQSNMPADVAVNTWTINDTVGADYAAVSAAFVDFYTDGTAGNRVSDLLSGYLSNDPLAASIEVFTINTSSGELDPVGSIDFTLPGPSAGTIGSLPFEVAICLSLVNVTNTEVTAARRRGRIYLGPLNIGMLTDTLVPVIDNDTLEFLAGKLVTLTTALSAANAPLAIWSRANQQIFDVDGGFIDNEFDTQRRRQVEATNREVWTAG